MYTDCMKMAICHPDRPQQAKSLCAPCYMKDYDLRRKGRAERRKDPADYSPNYRVLQHAPKTTPTCGHPDRSAVTKGGLCGACYQKARRSGEIVVGVATCHPDRPVLARGLCHQCYSKEKYWDDPEKYRQAARDTQASVRKRVRDQMIEAYGGKCACVNCPETDTAFLTLDHINGDGKQHRAKVGSHTYNDLRRKGWPKDGYRLLCWNCNSMTRGGVPCPHETR